MPTSQLAVWPDILYQAWVLGPQRVLDVGPGWGKASYLLREYVNKDVVCNAVEMWEPYIPYLEEHKLYEEIVCADICNVNIDWINSHDLVLMIDVIEHIARSEALELLDKITCPIIICTPQDYFKSVDYPPTERHISHWLPEDFGSRLVDIKTKHKGHIIRLAAQGHPGIHSLGESWELASQQDAKIAISPAMEYDLSGQHDANLVFEVLPEPNTALLEFGCGDGRMTQWLARHYSRIVAVDISHGMLDLLERRLLDQEIINFHTICTNGLSPFGTLNEGICNAVFSHSVLMHNRKDDVRRIVGEFRKLLQPGDPFVFQLPCYELGRKDPESWIDIAIWGELELERLADMAGFKADKTWVNPGSFDWNNPGPFHGNLHVWTAK